MPNTIKRLLDVEADSNDPVTLVAVECSARFPYCCRVAEDLVAFGMCSTTAVCVSNNFDVIEKSAMGR